MREWSTAAKIGLCLVCVAVLGTIVTALLVLSIHASDRGTKNVKQVTSTISNMEWKKYTNTEVTGKDVKTYMELIRGEQAVAFINTKGWRKSLTGMIWCYGTAVKDTRVKTDSFYNYNTAHSNLNDPEYGEDSGTLCLRNYEKDNAVIACLDYNKTDWSRDCVNDKKAYGFIDDEATFLCRLCYDQKKRLCGVYFEEK